MMSELKEVIEKINNLDKNVALLSMALLGDKEKGIEGFCYKTDIRLDKIEDRTNKHETYIARISGAGALIGFIWAIIVVFIGRHK